MQVQLTNSFDASGMKVVVLDLDGVLIGPSNESGRWDATLLADLGVDPSVLAREFFAVSWKQIVIGQADIESELAAALQRIGSPLPPRELLDYWHRMDSRVQEDVVKPVQDWRTAGEDRIVVLASNQDHLRADYLSSLLLDVLTIDGALWSFELGCRKDDPKFFEAANSGPLSGAASVTFFDDEPKHADLAAQHGWSSHVFVNAHELATVLMHLS